jgi:hypothetical protein
MIVLPSDYKKISRSPVMAAPAINGRHPLYLIELMDRLGIEPGEGVIAGLGLSYATAVHRCEACPAKQECRDWLASAPKSVSLAPRFCPNNDILFELQVDRPPLHRAPSPSAPKTAAEPHAHIADLERLEDEIDQVLLCQSIDEALGAQLKSRRSYLREEIACLRRQAATKPRSFTP